MFWAQGILDGGRRLRLNRRDVAARCQGLRVPKLQGGRLAKRYHRLPARTRRIAGLCGFFLIQSREGPDR
jgi:hypothetical protein